MEGISRKGKIKTKLRLLNKWSELYDYTPLIFKTKNLKKSFRGYKESEVDQFLDDIIMDYESLYKENLELKDKILVLSEANKTV